jgi:hypothetical protein
MFAKLQRYNRAKLQVLMVDLDVLCTAACIPYDAGALPKPSEPDAFLPDPVLRFTSTISWTLLIHSWSFTANHATKQVLVSQAYECVIEVSGGLYTI